MFQTNTNSSLYFPFLAWITRITRFLSLVTMALNNQEYEIVETRLYSLVFTTQCTSCIRHQTLVSQHFVSVYWNSLGGRGAEYKNSCTVEFRVTLIPVFGKGKLLNENPKIWPKHILGFWFTTSPTGIWENRSQSWAKTNKRVLSTFFVLGHLVWLDSYYKKITFNPITFIPFCEQEQKVSLKCSVKWE